MGNRQRPAPARDEARERVLRAGLELLTSEPRIPQRVGLIDAIRLSQVPQRTAYRAFAGDDLEPQRVFNRALIRAVAEWGRAPTIGVEGAVDAFAANRDLYDDRTPARLGWLLGEVHRLGGNAFTEAMESELAHWLYVDACQALDGPGDPDPDLVEIVELFEGPIRDIALLGPMRQTVEEVCGLRLRAGVEWEVFSETLVAVSKVSHVQPFVELPSGRDGEAQSWSHVSLVMIAVTRMAMEPDPAAEMSADLDQLGLPLDQP